MSLNKLLSKRKQLAKSLVIGIADKHYKLGAQCVFLEDLEKYKKHKEEIQSDSKMLEEVLSSLEPRSTQKCAQLLIWVNVALMVFWLSRFFYE